MEDEADGVSKEDLLKKEEAAETGAAIEMSDEVAAMLPASRAQDGGQLKQQNHEKENTLAEAKDRAQTTATTAMSIVNVALLKELLDQGSEGNKFYTPVLTLICVSLAFQILVGALCMMVSHMRTYFKKYGDDMCDDCLSNICWVKIRKRKNRHENCDEEHGSQCCSWCPVYVSTDVHPHYEYKLMDRYDDWCSHVTDFELTAAEAAVHLKYMTAATKEAREKQQHLVEQLQLKQITNVEFEQKVNEINKKLERGRKEKQDYIKAQKSMRIAYDRGLILVDKVDDIRRNHVLKQISFWQGVINYLLYFIFIFNAFIAGLGVFGGDGAASTNEASTAEVTQTP